MGKIDEENQAKQEEEDGTCQGDVVAPKDEETVRNEEADDDEANPGDDLGAPEAILNRATAVS